MALSRSLSGNLTTAMKGVKLIAGGVTTDSGGDVASVTGLGFTAAHTSTGKYTITVDSYTTLLFAAAIDPSNSAMRLASSTSTTVVFDRVGNGTDVQATGTITCDQASAVATTDILTINGVTYASVGSSADAAAGEWELGASDTEMGTNLAAAINGHTSGAAVSAAADTGVVTVTADAYGGAGHLTWSEVGDGMTLSPTTALAGGYNDPEALEDLVSDTFNFIIYIVE